MNKTETVGLQNPSLHIDKFTLCRSTGFHLRACIIYTINDMNEHFDGCTLIQYANDTQFLHSGPMKDLNLLVQKVETTHGELQ